MPNRRLGAGQRAKPATRGGYLASGTRGQSPWCSPRTETALESARKPLRRRKQGVGTPARREAAGCPVRAIRAPAGVRQ